MVLQALADPGQVLHERDPERRQMLLRPDPRQHQELRRVDGAAAQDDLASGACFELPAAPPERDADGAAALEEDLVAERLGHDLQIAPLHRRPQIPDCGRAAPAVARCRLVVAGPVLTRAVEIVIARKAERDGRLDKSLADRVMIRHIRDAERAVGAVELVGATRLMLGAFEIGQHVVERPAGIAELAPMVEILGLPADIDHAVDRGRAAEHLAPRPVDTAVAGPRIGLRFVAPIDGWVDKGLAEAERNVDPAVVVLAAGFEEKDARCRLFAEPRRDGATGGAGANHDEIGLDRVELNGHPAPPYCRGSYATPDEAMHSGAGPSAGAAPRSRRPDAAADRR